MVASRNRRRQEEELKPGHGGWVSINSRPYPVVKSEPSRNIYGYRRQVFAEYGQAIREGQTRRTDRQFLDFREVGGDGFPRGLGYKRGPQRFVAGGIWRGELRCEVPGEIFPPLIMNSQTLALGNLSGEVAAAGRIGSINTDLGGSSGISRLYGFAGVVLWRTVSDTNFTWQDSTYSTPTGAARILCMAEVFLNNTRYVAIGMEQPDGGVHSLRASADPTATPPVFSNVNGATQPLDTFWIASLSSLRETYACYRDTGGVGVFMWTFSTALGTDGTQLDTDGDLHRGCQLAGIIGERLYIIDPNQDAQTNPNAYTKLKFFDARNRRYTICAVAVRTITIAARYDHPTLGAGIVYTDGTSVHFWRDSEQRSYDLGFDRYQGPDITWVVKGFNPRNHLLTIVAQNSTTTAQLLTYVPRTDNPWWGSWYPWSRRVTTDANLVLPGGTPRGCTLPWGAEGNQVYYVNPSATNSTIYRQTNYPNNPSYTQMYSVDTFESGALTLDTPLYDDWGGPEEPGALLGYFYEGENIDADDTVRFYYTTDLTTYTAFAAAETAEDQTQTLGTPVAARRFGIRLELTRGATATQAPNAGGLVVKGMKEPATRLVHEFILDVGQMGSARWSDLASELDTARDTLAGITLSYGSVSVTCYVLDYEIAGDGPPAYTNALESVLRARVRLLELT